MFMRLPGWLVMSVVAWPVARYMLMLMMSLVATRKLSGSETTWAPSGMSTEVLPEKMAVCRVFVSIKDSPAE